MSEKPAEDNPGTAFVSYREYAASMKSIEHRLTRLESRQFIEMAITAVTLLTVALTALRIFMS